MPTNQTRITQLSSLSANTPLHIDLRHCQPITGFGGDAKSSDENALVRWACLHFSQRHTSIAGNCLGPGLVGVVSGVPMSADGEAVDGVLRAWASLVHIHQLCFLGSYSPFCDYLVHIHHVC